MDSTWECKLEIYDQCCEIDYDDLFDIYRKLGDLWNPLDFSKFIPIPKMDASDIHDWCLSNWGCSGSPEDIRSIKLDPMLRKIDIPFKIEGGPAIPVILKMIEGIRWFAISFDAVNKSTGVNYKIWRQWQRLNPDYSIFVQKRQDLQQYGLNSTLLESFSTDYLESFSIDYAGDLVQKFMNPQQYRIKIDYKLICYRDKTVFDDNIYIPLPAWPDWVPRTFISGLPSAMNDVWD